MRSWKGGVDQAWADRIHAKAGLPQVIVVVVLRLDDMTRDDLFAEPLDSVFELTKKRPTTPQNWVKEHIGNFAVPKTPGNA